MVLLGSSTLRRPERCRRRLGQRRTLQGYAGERLHTHIKLSIDTAILPVFHRASGSAPRGQVSRGVKEPVATA
jgi:hypothetical protein